MPSQIPEDEASTIVHYDTEVTHFQTLSGKEEYTVNPTLEMLAATKEIHFQEQEEAENGTSKTKEIFHEQEEAEMALPYRGKDAQLNLKIHAGSS
jgi:hypothetical protein